MKYYPNCASYPQSFDRHGIFSVPWRPLDHGFRCR